MMRMIRMCTLSMAVIILLTPTTTMAASTTVTLRRNNAIPGVAAGGDVTEVHDALRGDWRTVSSGVHAATTTQAHGKGSSPSPLTAERQRHLPRPTLDEDARHRQWHAIKLGLMVAMPILAALIIARLCCWTPARVVLITTQPSKRTRTKEAELTRIETGAKGHLSEGTFNPLDRSMTRTTMCSTSPSRSDLRNGRSFDSASSAPRTTTARTTSTSTSSVSTSLSSTDLASLPQQASSSPPPPPLQRQHLPAPRTSPPSSDVKSPPPPSQSPLFTPTPSSPPPQPPRPPHRSSSLLPLSTSDFDASSTPAPIGAQRSMETDEKEGALWQDGSACAIFEPKDITADIRHTVGASPHESGANGSN